MRCLTFLVIVALFALLGITGYNYLQIQQLERDMSAVKAKVLIGDSEKDTQLDIAAALKIAEEHAAQARDMIARGRDAAARIELDKSLQSLDKAAKLTKKLAKNTARKLDIAISATRKQIDEMWKEASRKNQKGRSEQNGSK